MPTRTSPPKVRNLPGMEVVGRGMYLRPNQPYELKEVVFARAAPVLHYSAETRLTY